MLLNEREKLEIEFLRQQEATCVERYARHAKEANDQELKNLFNTIEKEERKHYESLTQVLNGTVPPCNTNDSMGKNYQPKATYNKSEQNVNKEKDCYLATDSIGAEKLLSSEYNDGIFIYNNSDVRKLLADIQIEEQNHAEMMWKYKVANGMAEN